MRRENNARKRLKCGWRDCCSVRGHVEPFFARFSFFLRAFARIERATLEGAGHMMHWTQPRELAGRLIAFL